MRLVALFGTAVVLVQKVIASFPLAPRQGAAFVVLIIALVVVPLAMAVFLRDGMRRILDSPDLLVPPLMLTFALGALGAVASLPLIGALLQPGYAATFLGISFSVSAMLILTIILSVAHGAWMTTLVLRVVREGDSDPVRALSGIRRWFLRVFGLDAICITALMALMAVGVVLVSVAFPLGFLVIGGGALALNLATAALLPAALDERLRFGQALSHGVRESLAGMRRWIVPLLVQLLLLGAVTFVSVSYSDGSGWRSTTNWKVNGFWVGGYENGCRWYGAVMQALEAPKVEIVTTALEVLFLVLAVAMKVVVVERLTPGSRHPSAGTPMVTGTSTEEDLARPRGPASRDVATPEAPGGEPPLP